MESYTEQRIGTKENKEKNLKEKRDCVKKHKMVGWLETAEEGEEMDEFFFMYIFISWLTVLY